jgi:hypothetical protein
MASKRLQMFNFDRRKCFHITEKMLGNKLGGILSVYNKSEYINEQRKAYDVCELLVLG